jgi:hypothetical protein
MTVALAWVGMRKDGLEHLYIGSDSRLTGLRMDVCPKILVLPRSDCALCFAGDTHATYPLMLQLANAIAAHEPARDRSLDISKVKDHLLRLFKDMVNRFDLVQPLTSADAQFLFAGYSWRKKDFRIWSISYEPNGKRFLAREARSFCSRLSKAAFIGDRSKQVRAKLARQLNEPGAPAYLEPFTVLAEFLRSSTREDSIGGAPQLVRITQHMSTRPLCVRWDGSDTLFGRPLFDYENTDYLIVEPFSRRIFRPRKYGYRVDYAGTSGENPFKVTALEPADDEPELFE